MSTRGMQLQVQFISLQTGKQSIFMSMMQDTFARGKLVFKIVYVGIYHVHKIISRCHIVLEPDSLLRESGSKTRCHSMCMVIKKR